ncbi:MAG: AmmeMemoRadiSam system protein A [Myxococcota bacterium]
MSDVHPLLRIARDALAAHLGGEGYQIPELPPPFRISRGAFVTLTAEGRLRGCIGHLSPTQDTLAAEIALLAVLAGTRDSRFPPVTLPELARVKLEVSLLSVPEPANLDLLDARRYGVIVTSGKRRGVLLPDLEGVDTPREQIRICRSKAGIGPEEPVELERFEVEKLAEP